MAAIALDDALETEIRAVAAPDEDLNAFIAAAAKDAIARRKRQAAGRAEMQAMIDGPWHTLEESNERMRRKYNIPDPSHLTREELAEQAEAYLATLPPEKIAEAERLGLI